jgi:hypothetical protein
MKLNNCAENVEERLISTFRIEGSSHFKGEAPQRHYERGNSSDFIGAATRPAPWPGSKIEAV